MNQQRVKKGEERAGDPPNALPRAGRWQAPLAAALLVLAGAAVYANSLSGVFIFDDQPSIVDNPTIRQIWPPWEALCPPRGGETVSGRPLLNVSLALNYAFGRLNVRGYHVANLAIHLLNGLLLFGILRRTLRLPPLRPYFGSMASGLAWAVALLWIVHPLQTESVT